MLRLLSAITVFVFSYFSSFSNPIDSKFTAILKNEKFAKFYQEIVVLNPNLKANNLKFYKESPISSDWKQKVEEPLKKSDLRWLWSPDGSKAISTVMEFGQPDSSLRIYNREGNKKDELLNFCGTTCSYWGTYWLDNDNFVFLMDSLNDPDLNRNDTFTFYLEHYDLKNNKVTVWSSPKLNYNPKVPNVTDWKRANDYAAKELGW